MDENGVFYFKIALSLVLGYYWIRIILRSMALKRFYRTIKNATIASPNSKLDDYVYFSGHLTLPKMQSPISRKVCDYWALLVRGVFKTKRKSPNRGMQTHRPVIYHAESDEQPLIVSNKKQLIHLAIQHPLRFMVKLKKKRSKSKTLNVEAAKENDKSKYKSYLYDEYWLPQLSLITVWGTISGINKNTISLSDANDTNMPTLIYNGNRSSVFRRFYFRFFTLLLLLAWIPVVMLFFFINPLQLHSVLILFLGISTILATFLLVRIGRIHFVR